MRRVMLMSSVMFLLLFASVASAQVRGIGRLQGNVFDKNTGKPVAGATITLGLPAGNTKPIIAKTDARGHWAAIGLTAGRWNIDVAAPGYATGRGTAEVSEVNTPPPIRTELELEAKPEPAPAAAVTAPVTPSISQEAVDVIKEGETLLRTTAASADEAKDNAKRAVADFERVLPMISDDSPELKDVKNQVLQVLAQAYYKSGNVKNAIATMEQLDVRDPAGATPDAAHTAREIILANLYLENGQLDQGKALLEKLPPSAITDPTAYLNIGILFLNKNNPGDAAAYFTKAIGLDPKRADVYYYRGLAEVQMKKNKEAKADLLQAVALAPDSQEAKDSKQLLANLK